MNPSKQMDIEKISDIEGERRFEEIDSNVNTLDQSLLGTVDMELHV